jgi:hypothetical protein
VGTIEIEDNGNVVFGKVVMITSVIKSIGIIIGVKGVIQLQLSVFFIGGL